jgi:hypothetical protein
VITNQQLQIAGFDTFVVKAYCMPEADCSHIFQASLARILIRHAEFSHLFLNPDREIQQLLTASASDDFLLEVASQTSDEFFVMRCLSRLSGCRLYVNRSRNLKAHFEMRQNDEWIIPTLTSESFYIREAGYHMLSVLRDRSHSLNSGVLFALFERIASAVHLNEAVEFFSEHSDNLPFALVGCLFGREKIEPWYAEALFEHLGECHIAPKLP